MTTRLPLFLAGALLLLAGCTGGRNAKRTPPPEWVSQRPISRMHYIGIGSAVNTPIPGEAPASPKNALRLTLSVRLPCASKALPCWRAKTATDGSARTSTVRFPAAPMSGLQDLKSSASTRVRSHPRHYRLDKNVTPQRGLHGNKAPRKWPSPSGPPVNPTSTPAGYRTPGTLGHGHPGPGRVLE